ncbi:hypothetical protein F511_14204 [Dorcoceras hygrometricum]|uniref:CCHC-type domain-containing protein n=1 Tax=Dorcoceras hygrometricum TaxID=472368 RepID=A0A2Z7AHE6_9LAMI|nr:hypothetical protein F511_14204 [Dorcoceras hygrometricum]
MVFSGSPATFMEAVKNAVVIEESLMDPDAPVPQTTGRASQPAQVMSQSYQSPQGSQQSSRQQFRPRGKQFKKKGHSSSSGSCGGRHDTSKCRGVRGLCHLCGQPGHFARACPSIGGLSLGQSQQGSAGGSSLRQQPFTQSQRSGFQPREPSRFGGPFRPQFQIPQQAQANALNREQAEETPGMVIGDSIGYPRMSASGESLITMHRLLHASGSHPIPMPYDPKTNQYNQELGLIHSTNGNHLESPNEGSSIDHQVTIYLHAQNITMFHTNDTWYFASQILVSNSGGLILILTAQSTRNMFRIQSDY